ncbi:MFN2 [Bugula neritina]|uniref:MFN2 n=1 Tax=Bugula neritina TaxID=10212 RepID=A0A7J7K936_BUGNE|nr:MFN2 [Bugula neritina]
MSGLLRTSSNIDQLMTSIPPPHSAAAQDRMSKSVVTSSPLKIFGNAKKSIRDIFGGIASYVEESKACVQEINDERICSASERVKIGEYTDKVAGIREVLSRDHMKVVFFGRTSNGKSTVINTMLRSKILPSGIGHTTHCFVQVEGSDTTEGYMLLEGSAEKRPVSSLKDLANALSSVKLEENSLIRICWPKNMCSLLKDDVVLLDSPGIDVTPDLDGWIDKFCLDADVFVLVANAESTLMQTEKNFFLKVSEMLSKPTVFILNNRWDASASEPDMMEMVRSQHMERNMEFLCNELKVVNKKEAEGRIFFVSAKEALHNRLTEKGAVTTPLGSVLEGYQSRLFEFAQFERTFEECISRSAVKTKFAQHAHKGKLMACELRELMEALLDRSQSLREEVTKVYSSSTNQLAQLERQLAEISTDIENTIRMVADDVQLKVSRALSDELRKLYVLVDEFDRPFHPDAMFLNVYKNELHQHVENGLGKRIQDRCSQVLGELVQISEQRMADKLLVMLPSEKQEAAHNLISAKPQFSVEYRLDAKNLCADFQESIEFRFSFSPAALLSRYMRKPRVRLTQSVPYLDPGAHTPVTEGPTVSLTPAPTASPPPAFDANTDLAVTLLRLAPAISSTTTISCICLAGAVNQPVRRLEGVCCGGRYLRLTVCI